MTEAGPGQEETLPAGPATFVKVIFNQNVAIPPFQQIPRTLIGLTSPPALR